MFVPPDIVGSAAPSASVERPGRSYLTLDRRLFLEGIGTLALGVALVGRGAKADVSATGLEVVEGGDATPSLWIAIGEDGTVSVTCHRSEMGQQTWTAMAQLVVEELEAKWDDVEIVQAEGHPRYGDQNTDGSRSVRFNFVRLRTAGAAMRMMLERAAAAEWGVAAEECRGEQGEVIHAGSDRRLSYGALAAAAGELDLPALDDVALKDRSEWRLIGKDTPSLTVPKIVRGEGTFGMDIQLPDMVYAVVARPPQVFGSVTSVDDSAALSVPGVLRTVELAAPQAPAAFQPLGGVAVVATDSWAAIQGRNALQVEWEAGPNADYDSEAFAEEMMATAKQPGDIRMNRGDVDAALESATTRLAADYYVPHLSQSPMEPPAAAARWTGGKLEAWGCVQDPQTARATVAALCGVPEDDVTVHVTWLGGAFGRKSKPDFLVEAALIARDVGRAVKVFWTREDEVRHGFYHTISAQHLEAGLDEDGTCTAFLHRTVFPPIMSTFQPGLATPTSFELDLGASDNPFAVDNFRLESGDAPAHLRIGWLRSVANIYHAFALQSFAAELAHAAGRDQKDYLLDLIGEPRLIDPNSDGFEYSNYSSSLEDYPIDTGRLRNVTEIAAEMADWGRTLPTGHGLGIAVHRSFVTYVATAVEVAVDEDGRLTIPHVWSAIDAGTVVNRRHVIAQTEGGTLYGLSNALYGAITAKNGVGGAGRTSLIGD